eukprot:TRINITY_DN20392_c0_g1_i1.p1 TRINITY_DN20392_c0_g1~~TRINITY_DN20392_c0_g1_i1.p1  ORF type:complete len:255 (-),score=31.34 TRINITY_DN20392_c0_g1_i1:100-837(-)
MLPLGPLCLVAAFCPVKQLPALCTVCRQWAEVSQADSLLWMLYLEAFRDVSSRAYHKTDTPKEWFRCLWTIRFDPAQSGSNLVFSNNNRTAAVQQNGAWRRVSCLRPCGVVERFRVRIDTWSRHADVYVGVCDPEGVERDHYRDHGPFVCYKPVGSFFNGTGTVFDTEVKCAGGDTIHVVCDRCDSPGAIFFTKNDEPKHFLAFELPTDFLNRVLYPTVWLYWPGVQVTITGDSETTIPRLDTAI